MQQKIKRQMQSTQSQGKCKELQRTVCAQLTVKNRRLRGETFRSQSADVMYEGQ